MKCRFFMLGGVLMALPACQRPVPSNEPTQRQVMVTEEDGDGPLWTASQDVLRRYFGELDRVDATNGVVVSRSQTSQHFFEFWRHDVDTAYDLMESSLNTIRRRATVRIERDEEGEGPRHTVTVVVEKQRFATPERQFNTSSAALRFFGDVLPGAAGETRVTEADEYWIDMGRDEAMERYLMERILIEAGTGSSALKGPAMSAPGNALGQS